MMAGNFRRSYKFALKTSCYLAFFMMALSVVVLTYLDTLEFEAILVLGFGCFLFAFLIIQYRVEFFIYKNIKKIYEKVSLLSMAELHRDQVTTDMTTLSKEVERFAEGKKMEIEALKIRDSYRKDFMGNISHELKTPLFTVQGYIETLLGGAMKDKKVRKKYLNRAAKGVERLIYIVRDLDMITKLETGELRLHKEQFDIIEVVRGVFDLFEMKAAKKNITLVFDKNYEQVRVYADKERVQQVLTNLVVNSIKYGKHDGTTEVMIENHSRSKIIVRVSDNGEGIEKIHIPRLFERFYRVDKSGSRKEGGSGLGLSIVKHLLEAHHERIFIESTYGMGSEFSFTLKKAKEAGEITSEPWVV